MGIELVGARSSLQQDVLEEQKRLLQSGRQRQPGLRRTRRLALKAEGQAVSTPHQLYW